MILQITHGAIDGGTASQEFLADSNYEDLLIFADTTRYPIRNRLIVLLSVKAGLRAGEIANLTWDMVLDPTGAIGPAIELRDWAAKKGSGRCIPIHPELRAALVAARSGARRLSARRGDRLHNTGRSRRRRQCAHRRRRAPLQCTHRSAVEIISVSRLAEDQRRGCHPKHLAETPSLRAAPARRPDDPRHLRGVRL